jgi:hypothetical protein
MRQEQRHMRPGNDVEAARPTGDAKVSRPQAAERRPAGAAEGQGQGQGQQHGHQAGTGALERKAPVSVATYHRVEWQGTAGVPLGRAWLERSHGHGDPATRNWEGGSR